MPVPTVASRRRSRVARRGERSWGKPGSALRPDPKAPRPVSKRVEAAEAALAEILELFADPERLPSAIAQTVIARQQGTSPSVHWSLPNQLLVILAGSCDARGIRQWTEVGRHVVKGSKAVRILAPRTRTLHETDAETGEERDRVLTVGFVGVPVFRVEDTEGAPLEIPDYRPASLPPLYGVAERLGVDVDYLPFVDRFRGYYSPGDDRIVLCSHDERTWFHELAHAAHARVLAARGDSLRGGQDPAQEVVGEVVAATLCRLLDLDGYIAHSAEYIASYAGKGGSARAAMRVLADVQAVLLLLLEPDDAPAEHEREPELVAA
jgi:hypothetical protein